MSIEPARKNISLDPSIAGRRKREFRDKEPRQLNLFENGPAIFTDVKPSPDGQNEIRDMKPGSMTDEELIAAIPKSGPHNVREICDQILGRGLNDKAIPGLVQLWNRLTGYGITNPYIEQICSIETLGKIGSDNARDALSKIIANPALAGVVLSRALEAANDAGCRISLKRLERWLEHDSPRVRTVAYSMAERVSPQFTVLHAGIADADSNVRRAALIAAGNLGYEQAMDGLLSELRKVPTSRIVRALLEVADEETIISLGRFADQNEDYRVIIADDLIQREDPKFAKIGMRLKGTG
ncbi:MAG: hypothetical protein OXE85_09725 [Roseovarius sp.]|nr:hypothetical protein [Roseovarius sp.]